jgi:uncharacterized membrane protein YgaE (UPF0421/DUF939 family)
MIEGTSRGYIRDMPLALLLIVIGIVLAILVHWGLGIACILIGLVLLIWPAITGRSSGTNRV